MKFSRPLTVAFTLLLSLWTAAANAHAICKYESNDIGTIVGKGPTFSAAFEDAATKCYDKRASQYRKKHSGSMEEDTGLTIIDVCANLHCS